MQKLIHPQEVEVFYLLPAIRRDIALCLKAQGKDQKEIAKLLGVSEPSVSHYFNSKRAKDVHFSNEIKTEIQNIVKNLKTQQDLVRVTQKLLRMIQSEKEICKVCQEVNKTNLPKKCEVCFD